MLDSGRPGSDDQRASRRLPALADLNHDGRTGIAADGLDLEVVLNETEGERWARQERGGGS